MTDTMIPVEEDVKQSRRRGKLSAGPAPIDDEQPDQRSRWKWAAGFIMAVVALGLVSAYLNQSVDYPAQAADIGSVYSSAVIVTVQPGDTLDTVVQTSFPNFLVEGKSDKDVARFQSEWRRLIALRSGLAGGNITAGQLLAIPALPTDTGAISSDQITGALHPKAAEATTQPPTTAKG